MLTMNYQDLQYRYTKPKKKKQSQLKEEKYPLTRGQFSASTWKDYKEWVAEQKLREEVKNRLSKPKKKKKGKVGKGRSQNAVRGAKNALIMKEKYYQELEHPLWLKKRMKILERDQHKCVLCGGTENLQVHHTKYHSDKKAWEYPNSTLVTLCKECHQKVHSDKTNELYPKYE